MDRPPGRPKPGPGPGGRRHAGVTWSGRNSADSSLDVTEAVQCRPGLGHAYSGSCCGTLWTRRRRRGGRAAAAEAIAGAMQALRRGGCPAAAGRLPSQAAAVELLGPGAEAEVPASASVRVRLTAVSPAVPALSLATHWRVTSDSQDPALSLARHERLTKSNGTGMASGSASYPLSQAALGSLSLSAALPLTLLPASGPQSLELTMPVTVHWPRRPNSPWNRETV